eukprot:jgi/Ulvmu1/11705/UM008_0116.1
MSMDVWYNYDEHVPGPAPHSRPMEHGLAHHQMPHFYRHSQQGGISLNYRQAGVNGWAGPGAVHDLMSSHCPSPEDDCLELAHSYHREQLDSAADSLPGRHPQHEDASHPSGRLPDFSTVPVRGTGGVPAQLSWDVVQNGLQAASPSPTAPPFLPTIMEKTASRRSMGASSASSHRYSHTSGTAPQFGHHASSSPALLASSASAHSLHTGSFQNGAQQPGQSHYGSCMPPNGRLSFSGSDIPCAGPPKLGHGSATCRQASDHMPHGPPGYMPGPPALQKHQSDSRMGQVSDMASLIRQLADAPASVPAVAAALSATAPSFSLGLPGLTKLICDCSKRGEHAKALAVFHAAPALSLVPDRPLCNAAIHAAGRGGNGEAAAAIVLHMLATHIEPDAVTYRSAMETLSKHCSLELAVWVYLHMLASPMIPDRTACMILIMAAGRRGAWQVAEQVTLTTLLPSFPLSPLVAAGPPPGTIKAGERQLIHALCRASGASMTHDPTLSHAAQTPLQAAAAAAASAVAASEAAGRQPPHAPPLESIARPSTDTVTPDTGLATLAATNSEGSLPGSTGPPTRPCTNSSIASGGVPGGPAAGVIDGAVPQSDADLNAGGFLVGDKELADASQHAPFHYDCGSSENGRFPEGLQGADGGGALTSGRRRIASTGTDMPANPAQHPFALDQSVPSSMASSLLTCLVAEGPHGPGGGSTGDGPEGARRQWARTLSEPQVASARAWPHMLLPTLSSPGAAAAYAATAEALAQRVDAVLGAGDGAAAPPPPPLSGGRSESLAGRSATVDTDGTSTAADAAAAMYPDSADGGVIGEELPQPAPSDTHTPATANLDSPKRSSQLLLNLLKRSVGIRQQAGHSAAAWLQGGSPVHPASARGMMAAAPGAASPGRPQTGPAPVRPGLLAGDPLARACCNALLLAYAHAEQPLIGRAVALLESMIQTSGDISPDVLSFNTVLRMLSGAGNARASLALLQCMASCGVYPRVSTYAIALASAAVAGDAAAVVDVWRSMASLHVVPNIDCVNVLLGTLVQQGSSADGFAVFKAFTAPPLAIAPDSSTLALVMAAYLLLAPEDQNSAAAPPGSQHAQHGGPLHHQPLPRIVVLLHSMSMHVAEALAGVELMEHELAASGAVPTANQVGILRRECEALLDPVATPAGGVEWLGRHASLGQCMAQLLQSLQSVLSAAQCTEIVSRITTHCASEVLSIRVRL